MPSIDELEKLYKWPNQHIDMNQPEFDNYFEIFKHGYLMCRLMDKK